MAVGQFVTKQTWLLDEVEIRGVVSASDANPGDDVGTRDDFDITPDEGYRHLVTLIPGSNGVMHCETYPLPQDHTNRDQYWPLPQKDTAACFEVRDPATGVRRPLKVGDHVRVIGRWTIDHHPETCVTRARGLLRAGCVWPEFHPFQWDDITLVAPLPPSGAEVATLSLAAPIHEEVYLGGGKWLANELAGVSSKIFVANDGSNYHSTVTATLHVSAPPLPSGWTADASLVSVVETVTKNGTGAGVDSVRTITHGTDGIDVTATVAAPLTVQLGGRLSVADVDGPSRGTQVFQAHYGVSWRPRLAAAPVTVKPPAGMSDVSFDIPVENIGPDPVIISSAAVNEGDPAVFSVNSPTSLPVPAHGRVTLQGRFAPPASGHYRAELIVQSNDPAGDPLLIAIDGATADTSGRLRVRPQTIRLGVSTQVTIGTEDSASGTPVNGTATIDNYNLKGQLRSFQVATNQPFTATFYQEKEFDPELRKWIFGEKPSGVVNVPGYGQDPDMPIPFRFT